MWMGSECDANVLHVHVRDQAMGSLELPRVLAVINASPSRAERRYNIHKGSSTPLISYSSAPPCTSWYAPHMSSMVRRDALGEIIGGRFGRCRFAVSGGSITGCNAVC